VRKSSGLGQKGKKKGKIQVGKPHQAGTDELILTPLKCKKTQEGEKDKNLQKKQQFK